MIESMKNARTVGGRELLEELTKEFESICATGDIIYLGTPQTSESVYNNLPSRGYRIRIWTGRYPTVDQMEAYGEFLAPMLVNDIKTNPSLQTGGGIDGNQGQPTCPEMFGDDTLIEKELSQGAAKFQLQYMLNTALADQDRYPLKLPNLVVCDYDGNQAPACPVWSQDQENMARELPRISNRKEDRLFWAVRKPYDYLPYDRTVMYIDPAGGGKNADETAYAIIKLIGSYIYIADIGGTPGGYEEEKLMKLVEAAKEYNASTVLVEKNFGNGAHMSMLKPLFQKHHPVAMEEVWESGQKELRIIDVIEPILTRHQLIISPAVIRKDLRTIEAYPNDIKITYSLLYQMSMVTRDKGCLRHDDRLDALAGAIRHVTESIDYDTQAVLERKRVAEQEAFLSMWRSPAARLAIIGQELPTTNQRNSFGGRKSKRGRF